MDLRNKYTISARISDYTMEQINELKKMYCEMWNCDPETITTTDIIVWSIGMLHGHWFND